jgi:hypothetical protein
MAKTKNGMAKARMKQWHRQHPALLQNARVEMSGTRSKIFVWMAIEIPGIIQNKTLNTDVTAR